MAFSSGKTRATLTTFRPILAVIFFLILALWASLFTVREQDTELEPPPAKPEVRATVAIPVGIRGWDPHHHSCLITESVLCNVYDYLIWRSPEGHLEPGLATSWERLDSKTWRFNLRDDVFWHDGVPFDSEDVVFTLKRLAAIGTSEITPQYPHFRSIRKIIPVDDFVVDIITEYTDPAIPYRLSRMGSAVIPAHPFEELAEEISEEKRWQIFFDNPIGTGPYRPLTRVPDDRIRLTSSPDYWRGPAVVTDLNFIVVPDSSVRSKLLTEGRIDVATHIGENEWRDIQDLDEARLLRRVTPKVLVLNSRVQPGYLTEDPVVREAIDLAIDSQYLVDEILAGAATPTRTRVTPGSSGYHPELYNSYLHDATAAKKLLEEYDSKELSIQLLTPEDIHPELPQLAESVALMLEEVGFTVTVDLQSWGEYLHTITEGSQPALHLSIEPGCAHDCSLSFELLLSDDRYVHPGGFVNPDFTELFREATSESNPQLRARLFRDLAEYLAVLRPDIPLLHMLSNHGVSNAIEWTPRSDELLWMWPTVRAAASPTNQ